MHRKIPASVWTNFDTWKILEFGCSVFLRQSISPVFPQADLKTIFNGISWITVNHWFQIPYGQCFFLNRNFDQRTQKISNKTFQSHVYYSTFLLRKYRLWRVIWSYPQYCQTSNVRCTLIGNKIVDHSDVVGALPVGAAPKYIFILNLTLGFNGLGKDSCKTRWETFKFWDLMWLILEIWQCVKRDSNLPQSLLLQINPVYMDTACGLHNYLGPVSI